MRGGLYKAAGRFSDNDFLTTTDGAVLPGSDTLTYVLVGELFREPPAGEIFFNHSRTGVGDPPPTLGWSFASDPGVLQWVIAQGDAFFGRNYLICTHALADIAFPLRFVWCASVAGGVSRSLFNGSLATQNFTAGWTVRQNSGIGGVGIGVNVLGEGNPGPSMRVAAFLATEVEGLVDLTLARDQVKRNLQAGRNLDEGLTAFTPQHYIDMCDWNGGDVVDRISGTLYQTAGAVEAYGFTGVF